jgi:hypothetical protein
MLTFAFTTTRWSCVIKAQAVLSMKFTKVDGSASSRDRDRLSRFSKRFEIKNVSRVKLTQTSNAAVLCVYLRLVYRAFTVMNSSPSALEVS